MTNTTRLKTALIAAIAAAPAAQAAETWRSVSDFRESAGMIVGIILIVAFVACLILWLVGTLTKEQNPAQSKWCFKAVWMVGIGLPLISLIFYMLIGDGAVVKPKF